MSAAGFIEYASSGCLSADETYTIELLIERVRSKFDPDRWVGWSARNDAREAPCYEPSFSQAHARLAAAELQNLRWLSFQRSRDAERPIRNITALRFLSGLITLVLINNEVTDLTPLQSCKELRTVHLQRNPAQDLSPLIHCANLEELSLGDTRVDDACVLEALPKLRKLDISLKQVPTFKTLKCLPALTELELGSDPFDSFATFPQLPELRVFRGAHVSSLDGLEQFTHLTNLVNLRGNFDSLAPLAKAIHLTHANIGAGQVKSLHPLTRLHALRELWLSTEADSLDLDVLERLPALHKVTIKCRGREPAKLATLRAQLSPWDAEFRSAQPRYTPSLDLQVVEQVEFDRYDGVEPFGVDDTDTNKGLLSSELEWLDEQLEAVFAPDFEPDVDYTIPFRWGGARSRTVVLLSEPAIAAFPRLVLAIQEVLCHCLRDWIIYFQSDDVDPYFVMWLYADKMVTTDEYAAIVTELISMR